jgi:hypothetical protein
MKDARDLILVRCDYSGFVDGDLCVETMSGIAHCGVGLYVMVPVANQRAADDLFRRLKEPATG